MTIKYSIVIPTRNRAEYLPYAIQSVLDSSRTDIELIVSNNFSTDSTTEILAKITDPRLRVVSPGVSLPMAGHYEFAISQAIGEWITILGDDDAVMPYIFERLDYYVSKYSGVDIISSARAYYFWEGCEDLYGEVVINYFATPRASIRSTQKDLNSVLSGLRSCFDMPQIYTTGIVKRKLYEEIKLRSGGCFYHSIIPDMYSVVALSLARGEYLRIDEPLFWVGTSNKSMGRSDRIYSDAESFLEKTEDIGICVPTRLSSSVSYFLHLNAFSPMYIYECLLQCPLKSKHHLSNNIRTKVLAAVFNHAKNRERSEKDLILNEIWDEANRYSISKWRILILASFLVMSQRLINLLDLPSRILRRLGYNTNKLSFRSEDRSKYPTIINASREIARLHSEKLEV